MDGAAQLRIDRQGLGAKAPERPGVSDVTALTTNKPVRKKQVRDADATQLRILKAATKEFAKNGLGGARVDEIALRAKANKRMIYHYFENKDMLFQRVLERAYGELRYAERQLQLDRLPPREALEALVRFTWDYYIAHPEFVTLVNSANLHRARHLKNSEEFKFVNRDYLGTTRAILERGVAEGVFRAGIDPMQLTITIAAIGFYYFTNRHTLSVIFDNRLEDETIQKARLAFNIETILRLVEI